MTMTSPPEVQALLQRFSAVMDRLAALEKAAGVTESDALQHRQLAILDRLTSLEAACGLAPAAAAATPASSKQPKPQKPRKQPAAAAAAPSSPAPKAQQQPAKLAPVPPDGHASLTDPGASPTQRRLALELLERGIGNHRFVRCPPEYYDRPLEFRRGCLNAASVFHLCKTIVMENTRAHPSVDGWADPRNSKYYLVIVQYAARLNAEKLKSYIHKMNAGKVGKKFFNMRLAPEAVSDELSGFSHNAVSPVGIKTRLPIIMSHKIAELHPDFFFLGGGEVDLKVGFSAADFIAAYQPFVVDCTYEEGEGGGEEDEAAGGNQG